MEIKQVTSREYFRTLRTIHFSLISGVLLFAIVVIYRHFTDGGYDPDPELQSIFEKTVPVLIILGVIIGNFLFKKSMVKISKNNDIKQKTVVYLSSCITRLALIEGPALFTIVAFMFTGKLLFLGLLIAILVYMFMLRPTADRAGRDMKLDVGDMVKLKDPDEIVSEIKQTK